MKIVFTLYVLAVAFPLALSQPNFALSLSSIFNMISGSANSFWKTDFGVLAINECPEIYQAYSCLSNTSDEIIIASMNVSSGNHTDQIQMTYCSARDEIDNCTVSYLRGCSSVASLDFDMYNEALLHLCYSDFMSLFECMNDSTFAAELRECISNISTETGLCLLPDSYEACIAHAAAISCSAKAETMLTAALQNIFTPFREAACNVSIPMESTNETSPVVNSTHFIFNAIYESVNMNQNESVTTNVSQIDVPDVEDTSNNMFTLLQNSMNETNSSFYANVSEATTNNFTDIDSTVTPRNNAYTTLGTSVTQTENTTANSVNSLGVTSNISQEQYPNMTPTSITSAPPTSNISSTTLSSTAVPVPPFQCYECSSGAPGYWLNLACPADGQLKDWALETYSCSGPCVTTVSRWPLGDVVRSCSSKYSFQFSIPTNGCTKSNDDLVCFCSGNYCNKKDMTKEQVEQVIKFSG